MLLSPTQQSLFFVLLLFGLHLNISFIIAFLTKDNSWADVAWGVGFIVVAVSSWLFGGASWGIALLATTLVTIWGIRLAGHIALRHQGKTEDWRYAQWRKDWGRWWIVRSYVQVFMLQGVFLLMIASSFWYLNTRQAVASFDVLDGVGVLVWLVGFFFEAVGDYQLLVFKRNPANKGNIMTTGVWQYTRHPNYFGEATMWWGIFLLVVSEPWGWLTVLSPLTITFLLLGVSGVPMLEKKYEGNRDFEAYKKTDSRLLPVVSQKCSSVSRQMSTSCAVDPHRIRLFYSITAQVPQKTQKSCTELGYDLWLFVTGERQYIKSSFGTIFAQF
jgi:steroid 5-alpha reductase family enzyme